MSNNPLTIVEGGLRDEEIRLLLSMKNVMFADGAKFALQVYQDEELGVTKHVRIPTNGFPASKYGKATVEYSLQGCEETFTRDTLDAMKSILLKAPEKRGILEKREWQMREAEGKEAGR